MQKLRKGDLVIVRTGRDRGTRGNIEGVLRNEIGAIEHVLVSGVNVRIRHQRPDPMRQKPGGRERKMTKISVSNVAIYNPESSKADRVRIGRDEKGQRVRVFASTGKEIES